VKKTQEAIADARVEPDTDEYEERLMAKIDDRLLREIFAGLFKNDLVPRG